MPCHSETEQNSSFVCFVSSLLLFAQFKITAVCIRSCGNNLKLGSERGEEADLRKDLPFRGFLKLYRNLDCLEKRFKV